jgi:effector-binding domain-containing protein
MRGPFDQMPQAFEKIYRWLQAEGHKPRGMPLTVYLDDPSHVDPADVRWELRAPIEAHAEERDCNDEGLAIKRISTMTVATTMHRGPYDQVASAYERLMAWITDQDFEAVGPPMEAYMNDPGQVSPEEYLTEVMVPVRQTS